MAFTRLEFEKEERYRDLSDEQLEVFRKILKLSYGNASDKEAAKALGLSIDRDLLRRYLQYSKDALAYLEQRDQREAELKGNLAASEARLEELGQKLEELYIARDKRALELVLGESSPSQSTPAYDRGRPVGGFRPAEGTSASHTPSASSDRKGCCTIL